MKGFLTAHGQVFRKTHDLDELARPCEAIDSGLVSALDAARDLMVFAWEFRYPGGSEVPSVNEARNTLFSGKRGMLGMAKLNVSIDEDVRENLFKLVPPRKRSQVINEALRKELLQRKRALAAGRIQELRKRSATLRGGEIVASVRKDRTRLAR